MILNSSGSLLKLNLVFLGVNYKGENKEFHADHRVYRLPWNNYMLALDIYVVWWIKATQSMDNLFIKVWYLKCRYMLVLSKLLELLLNVFTNILILYQTPMAAFDQQVLNNLQT